MTTRVSLILTFFTILLRFHFFLLLVSYIKVPFLFDGEFLGQLRCIFSRTWSLMYSEFFGLFFVVDMTTLFCIFYLLCNIWIIVTLNMFMMSKHYVYDLTDYHCWYVFGGYIWLYFISFATRWKWSTRAFKKLSLSEGYELQTAKLVSVWNPFLIIIVTWFEYNVSWWHYSHAFKYSPFRWKPLQKMLMKLLKNFLMPISKVFLLGYK